MRRDPDPDLVPVGDGADLAHSAPEAGAPRPKPVDPTERVVDQLWWAAAVVWRRRWWIVAATVLAGAFSVWYSLQIPNRYRAETRVLLPDSGGDLSALIGRSSPAAAALLGGGGGGYTRYLAILTSRTTFEDVAEQFDLVEVYETGERPNPVDEAVRKLVSRTDFEVSIEYDYLAVQVLDEDPRRAAQMANAYVEVLNRENRALTQESAQSNRVYLGERLDRAEVEFDSVLAETQAFQERYGVVQPEAQGAAFMESLGMAATTVAQAEMAYEVLRAEYGDENDQVQAAAAGLSTARRALDRLTNGSEAVMPVAVGQLPEVGRRYAELQQGVLIQGEILQTLQPLYEQALLSERREADAVQVLDAAVPPSRKAEPGRSVLVVAATLSAGLLAVALVLGVALVRRWSPVVAARLQEAGA